MPARVEQLADLMAGQSRPPPLDVVGESLEALDAKPEPVRPHDDLAPQLVLVRIAQVRRARGPQSLGEVDRVGRLAREVLLKRNGLDFGLQPGQDHLVFGRRAKVVHRLKRLSPSPARGWGATILPPSRGGGSG